MRVQANSNATRILTIKIGRRWLIILILQFLAIRKIDFTVKRVLQSHNYINFNCHWRGERPKLPRGLVARHRAGTMRAAVLLLCQFCRVHHLSKLSQAYLLSYNLICISKLFFNENVTSFPDFRDLDNATPQDSVTPEGASRSRVLVGKFDSGRRANLLSLRKREQCSFND